jgi:glutamine synthetase
MDAMELEKADDTIAELLQMDTGINELHRRLLIVDQVYCELVGKNRQERLSRLLTKQQIRFMKSMKTFPSVLRTEYTYALLKENDNKKASKIKDEFEKMGAYYPYPQEIESERELMELAEQKSLI